MPRRGARTTDLIGLSPFSAPMIPTVWYRGGGASFGSAIHSEAHLNLAPIIIGRDCKLDRIALEITAIGTAGSLLRMGIYADRGDGYPGALVVDAGTVVGDGTTGSKELTIALPLRAGLYWCGAANQGAAGTRATTRNWASTGGSVAGDTGALPTGNAHAIAYNATGITGAFPAAFTSTKAGSGGAIVIHLRAST